MGRSPSQPKTTPLRQIADQIPLGFACRSCGDSAYNWVTKINRYMQTGELCCADFRDWCEKAETARAALEPEKPL